MAKETAVQSPSAELNVYVSSPSGPRAKETTFREWVVNNQIGMNLNNQMKALPQPIPGAYGARKLP